MPKLLDREDMMEAVANGIREGIVELGTSHGRFDVPHELFYDAVRQGVHEAVWQMITNATAMPCADFYDTLKEGITEAMLKMQIEKVD